MYAPASFRPCHCFSHHLYLSRQIHHRNLRILVISHGLQCETAGIPADIEDILPSPAHKDGQSLGERMVAIVMVEREPAFLHVFRQMRKRLVNRLPVSEMPQPRRPAFAYGLFKIEHPYIIDIMVEIHVDPHHLIVQKEPAGLGTVKPAFPVKQYSHSQGGFEKYLDSVTRQ